MAFAGEYPTEADLEKMMRDFEREYGVLGQAPPAAAAIPQSDLPEVPVLGPKDPFEPTQPMDIDMIKLEPLATDSSEPVFQVQPARPASSGPKPVLDRGGVPLSTPEMAHLLSSLLNPTGAGSPGFAVSATPREGEDVQTPSSLPNVNSIEDLGVPRIKIISLLNETLANAKDSKVFLEAAKKKSATWWRSLQSWWRKNGAAQTAPQTALLELYAPNIPLTIDESEIDILIALCEKRYDPTNTSDTMHALEDIGFFGDPDLVLSYHDDVNAPELRASLERRMEEFMELKLHLVEIAVISRVFPFSEDLNEVEHANSLFKTCAASLHALFDEARLDGQLRATLKRAVHTYALKAGGGLTNPDRRRQIDDFYDMKANQTIEGLSVDSFFFRERCPLFSKFKSGIPKVLGAGAFGIVFRYIREIPDNALAAPEEYAVKLQRVTTEELKDLHTPAYVELRLLYEVNRAAPHLLNNPGASKSFANHVYLHDWVRCQFNVRQQFAKIMTPDQQAKYSAYLSDEKGIYQIYVEEFVTGGTLEDHLSANDTSFDRMATHEAFMATMVQQFAHLETLGRLMRFTHHDMKPANILCQRVPDNTPIKYLVYQNTSAGTLYVPLAHTNGMVMKVADYGRSRAEVPYVDQDGTTKTMPVGLTEHSAYNPAHDVENAALMWLWWALRQKRDRIVGLDRQIFDFIHACVHKNYGSMKPQAQSDYGNLLTVLDYWRNGRKVPDAVQITWDRVQRFIHRIYAEHLWDWEDYPTSENLGAFGRILAHPALARYRVLPRDLTPSNSVVMNDYKFSVPQIPRNPRILGGDSNKRPRQDPSKN